MNCKDPKLIIEKKVPNNKSIIKEKTNFVPKSNKNEKIKPKEDKPKANTYVDKKKFNIRDQNLNQDNKVVKTQNSVNNIDNIQELSLVRKKFKDCYDHIPKETNNLGIYPKRKNKNNIKQQDLIN